MMRGQKVCELMVGVLENDITRLKRMCNALLGAKQEPRITFEIAPVQKIKDVV